MKAVWIIAAIWLGSLAGCRTAPPAALCDNAGIDGATAPEPSSEGNHISERVRTVACVEEAWAVELPLSTESNESEPERLTPPTQALTLCDLEQIAFQNHPALAAAAARMEAVRGRQVQAGRYPNPIIGYHGLEIGLADTAGQQGAFLSQRFVTGGKLRLDRAIAGKATDEAHFLLHAQQQRVLSDLRVRFYETLVAQKRVELTSGLAQIGEELVRATQRLIEAQLGSENDLLQAQIRADNAHVLLDNARNQRDEAWRRLAAVAGVPAMHRAPLVGQLDADVPSLTWEDCHTMVMSGHPELCAAHARLERAAAAVRRAKRQPIPDVDVLVSARHHNVASDEVANVQVGFPIPVFDRNQGAIRSAEAEWIAASSEVLRIELDLQDRLAVAYRRYANARQQVDRYSRQTLPRAQRSLDLVRQAYEKGQVPYLTLITSQQTHLEVSLSHLESLQELRTASAIIDGQLLTGSLSSRRAIAAAE